MTEFYSPFGNDLPHIPDDMTLCQFMLETEHPARPCPPSQVTLIDDATGRRVSGAELRTRAQRLSIGLKKRFNIGKNSVVCIFSPNDVDYPVAIWSVHMTGATVTPANPAYTSEELAHQLSTTRAVLILAHPLSLAVAKEAAKRVGLSTDHIVLIRSLPSQSSDRLSTIDSLVESAEGLEFKPDRLGPGEAKKRIAFLSFSSGTTGKPKACAISHFNIIANIIQTAVHYHYNDPNWKQSPIAPGDVATAVLPFFHIFGLVVNMHFLLFAGVTLVVMPKFNFTDFLASIQRYRITHLIVVPPQVVLLCKHPATKGADLSHVKYLVSGAAPLSPELTQQANKILTNCTFTQGYGASETCATVSFPYPTWEAGSPGSAGVLIPGTVARVIKPDGKLGKAGEQGELIVYGPSMAIGYTNNEEANKETFVNGWVRTGDEVIINEKGEVFIVDRLKEIIKVKGYQVAPAELEGHLLDHPDVADACVVSLLDDYAGELPLAYVVLNEKAKARVEGNPKEVERMKEAIKKHVSDVKVQYKWLTGGVEFISAIPKSPSGKMLRRVLRDQARKERASSMSYPRPSAPSASLSLKSKL